MKRWYKMGVGILIVVVLVLMFLWLMGYLAGGPKVAPGRREAKGVPAADLETMVIESVAVPVVVEAVGTVTARKSADVSSRLMAEIVRAAVDAGDTVTEDQTLFVLDSRDAEARVRQAREGVASAEAVLEQAELDAGRIERLYENDAATKQEYDNAQTKLRTAQASLEAARAALREAEVNLSYANVRSPVSGKVVDRLADPGDMAVPGRPLITVYDSATLRLEVSVPEHLRPKVQLGDNVGTIIEAVGLEFEGTVIEIIPASDASSRSFTVRVSVPKSDEVYPGMYGRIRLPIATTNAILIPPETVKRVGQLETVTVVEDGEARTRAIKTGKPYEGRLEVLSGLSEGEVIAFPKQPAQLLEK